jgi:hypothetical protein
MIMENVKEIKAELTELISKAIEILEASFNVEDFETENPATMLNTSLLGSLLDISELSEEDLKESV